MNNRCIRNGGLICIKKVRGTICEISNIAYRFLHIFFYIKMLHKVYLQGCTLTPFFDSTIVTDFVLNVRSLAIILSLVLVLSFLDAFSSDFMS